MRVSSALALSLVVSVSAHAQDAPPSAPRAPERCEAVRDHVRVMLQDLEASPGLGSSITGLGQVVAGEAARVQGYAVISAEEVRAVLDQEAEKQLLGCTGQSCVAEIAEALDADLVVGGRVDRAPDGSTLVSLTLLNARAVVVMNRVSLSWRGAENQLPEVMRAAAQLLMFEPAQRPRGAIQLVGLPAGARVFVDGEERTRDHNDGRIAGLEIGPHEVRAEAPDMEVATVHVVVKSGQQSAVPITLEPVGIPTLWLVVAGAGAVVLGGAAAVGVAYALGQSDVVVSAQVPALGVNDAERVNKGASGR